MSDKLEALKAAAVDFSKVGLNPITENYYLCECPKCGWIGSSGDINGGPDDEGCYCHICQDFTEVDEVVTGAEAFNKLLPCITALLAALEEKDQRIKDLEDSAALDQYRIKTLEALADQNDKQRDHWMKRANAAEQREGHLKADVAVMGKRIAELERANAAQDDHINQQQDRIGTLEKKNGELGKHVGKLEKLLKGTEESLIASVDNVAELEQRLQQPIKLRKCDIGIACEFISEHVVVSLAAVMVEAATAGFKAEVEGE